jgi:hypothetical protein
MSCVVVRYRFDAVLYSNVDMIFHLSVFQDISIILFMLVLENKLISCIPLVLLLWKNNHDLKSLKRHMAPHVQLRMANWGVQCVMLVRLRLCIVLQLQCWQVRRACWLNFAGGGVSNCNGIKQQHLKWKIGVQHVSYLGYNFRHIMCCMCSLGNIHTHLFV